MVNKRGILSILFSFLSYKKTPWFAPWLVPWLVPWLSICIHIEKVPW